MKPSPNTSHEPRREDDAFRTTRWTVVLEARGDSEEGLTALSALCEAYYEPVLVLLTRTLRDPLTARDVAHDFFANLLEGDRLAQVQREGGKFRAYLSGAVKHFVAHRREAERRLRRGAGITPVSLHGGDDGESALPIEDEDTLPPDLAFDRAWSTTVLSRALGALRLECEAEGRGEQFERLKPWLTGDAAHGAQIELARSLDRVGGSNPERKWHRRSQHGER